MAIFTFFSCKFGDFWPFFPKWTCGQFTAPLFFGQQLAQFTTQKKGPAHFAEFRADFCFLILFVLLFILFSEINGRIPTYFEIAIVT